MEKSDRNQPRINLHEGGKMRHLRSVRLGLVLCSVLVLAIVAIAAAQGMKSSDPVADRQRLMKLIGASWADIQAKVKAGNVEAVAVNVSSSCPA